MAPSSGLSSASASSAKLVASAYSCRWMNSLQIVALSMGGPGCLMMAFASATAPGGLLMSKFCTQKPNDCGAPEDVACGTKLRCLLDCDTPKVSHESVAKTRASRFAFDFQLSRALPDLPALHAMRSGVTLTSAQHNYGAKLPDATPQLQELHAVGCSPGLPPAAATLPTSAYNARFVRHRTSRTNLAL